MRGLLAQTWSARHRKMLEALDKKPWDLPMPEGPLILIIDGLWFEFEDKRHVLYVMALRGVGAQAERATFLRPVLLAGAESSTNWKKVIKGIPENEYKRIVALVSDGLRAIECFTKKNGWVLQRCHFHLIAEVKRKLGLNKKTIVFKEGRTLAYEAIQTLLHAKNEDELTQARLILQICSTDPLCPRRLRWRFNDFLDNLGDYRTYMIRPEFNLPTTTNVIENMNSRLRQMLRSRRGMKTPHSLELWTRAFVRFHPTSKCSGKAPN